MRGEMLSRPLDLLGLRDLLIPKIVTAPIIKNVSFFGTVTNKNTVFP